MKRVTVCPALECAGLFFFLHKQTYFLLFVCKTWSLVIQHCRVLLPPPGFLWMCAFLLILHLSQQVDWASVTSYIYIYTCTQHHMYPPNKIIKQTKLPFHHFKWLSYKKSAWQSTKKFAWRRCWCEICSRFGSVLALGVTWNAALFHGERGGVHGDGPICPPHFYQNGPFPMKLLYFIIIVIIIFLNSHYAGRRVTGCRRWQAQVPTIRKKHWSANAYLRSSNLEGKRHLI